MKVSLSLTTYQAGKVVFLSAKDNDNLIQLPRNFAKPMGMALQGNKMAVATLEQVEVMVNDPRLAMHYPKQPNTYDALYIPRSTFYTGIVDLHDLEWSGDKLWGVNTLFSCLCTIDDNYSFKPHWHPQFVSDLAPHDYCHLNGVAFENGKPRYVTALGQTGTPQGWRDNKANGGVLIDIETNEIILENLPMPHTPRIYDGELYVLLSATGELARVDVANKSYEVICSMDGFVRGMDRYGDYLFVGLSKLRTTSTAFGSLPIAQKSVFSGIMVIYLPKGSTYGYIKYENSVEEIFDVKVLTGLQRPGILNTSKREHVQSLSLPNTTFWSKGESEKK
jgi:uncharacterized protein (TIGR03032 family)